MPKKAIVLLAEGFEEVEAVTPINYLRRAGIEVTIAAIGRVLLVEGSRGIIVSAETTCRSLLEKDKLAPSAWDAVIVPGGLPGADNLAASAETGKFLKVMAEAGKLVCAICASPARVLGNFGLLTGKKFTCYPGQEANINAEASPGAERLEDRVVIDGNIITSQGPGTAAEFALAIVTILSGKAEAEKLAGKLLL